MRNIKGPKSALSDFIAENKITIKPNKIEKQVSVEKKENTSKPKRQKKIMYEKPVEIVNLEDQELNREYAEYEKILDSPDDYKLDDEMLKKIAKYLSRKRKMNKFSFDFLVNKCLNELFIFDCSSIKNFEYDIAKNLRVIELHQCGQLTDDSLNFILNFATEIEVLKVTGGFLLENFRLPKKLKVLDVTHCSRLSDSFIDQINQIYDSLDELRLSFCYGISKDAVLKVEVKSLFVCETQVTEKFYESLRNIYVLSIKKCPNINSLNTEFNLEYLDIDAIVTIDTIPKNYNLRYLDISDCKLIENINFLQLEHLNVSNIDLNEKHIYQILKLKNLKTLNLSWNTIVDDEILNKIVNLTQLTKVYVFGCFNLTKESVKLAYEIKNRCVIIGNPAETAYLLNE